jgi:hypothetical protein
LPVEQAQFLQFAPAQAAEPAFGALIEKLLQPRPIRFALF